MWFDVRAKMAEMTLHPAATSATSATNQSQSVLHVAEVASVAGPQSSKLQPPCDVEAIRCELEERAAIREYDGGQSRSEAEAGALADVAEVTEIEPQTLASIWASR